MHMLGGMSIDIKGKARHSPDQRRSRSAPRSRACCATFCTGRFYDFLKAQGQMGLVLRPLAYREGPASIGRPAAKLKLDRKHLAKFPGRVSATSAYLQSKIGYPIK